MRWWCSWRAAVENAERTGVLRDFSRSSWPQVPHGVHEREPGVDEARVATMGPCVGRLGILEGARDKRLPAERE